VNVCGGNRHAIEQGFTDQSKVAARVVVRNVALVAPEQMHVLKGQPLAVIARQNFIDPPRRLAAGESSVEPSFFPDGE
jgi:hypothetical protein